MKTRIPITGVLTGSVGALLRRNAVRSANAGDPPGVSRRPLAQANNILPELCGKRGRGPLFVRRPILPGRLGPDG